MMDDSRPALPNNSDVDGEMGAGGSDSATAEAGDLAGDMELGMTKPLGEEHRDGTEAIGTETQGTPATTDSNPPHANNDGQV
jgi:hypothetical protein